MLTNANINVDIKLELDRFTNECLSAHAHAYELWENVGVRRL